MKGYRLLILSASLAALSAAVAFSAPKPKLIPTEWELDFTSDTPMPIRVKAPGDEFARTYWYMTFTVANNTGRERIFVPDFTIYTDTGQVLKGSAGVSPAVFARVQQRQNNPLLKDMADVTGRLLQGDDNAEDGVVIFQDIDPDARSFDVFIGGLSGETVRIQLPREVEVKAPDVRGELETVRKSSIVLHKTRRLRFSIPGDATSRFTNPPVLVGQDWVMR